MESPAAQAPPAPSRPAAPAPDAAAAPVSVSAGRLWAAIGLNWLLPGAGFIFTGDRRRGWILLAILNGLFALGLLMRGSVIPPVFDPRSPAFNVINVLTFAVSLGSGGPSLLCLGAQAGEAGPERWLAGEPAAAAYDLGVFHILLAGALNYFVCCALYDRFRAARAGGKKSS